MAMNNDYFFVQADKDGIAKMVVEELNKGAILIGGICVTYHPDSNYADKMIYTQAMIKKGDGLTPFERGDI